MKRRLLAAALAFTMCVGLASAGCKCPEAKCPAGCKCGDPKCSASNRGEVNCSTIKEGSKPAAQAWNEKTEPENFYAKMEKELTKELNLTKSQVAKMKANHEKYKTELTPIMEQMHALRQKAFEIKKQEMEGFKAILTPEQSTKFESLKPQNLPEHGSMPPQKPGEAKK